MWIVVGAGSVGLALGARLARAGSRVRLVTRNADAARLLDRDGVQVEDPVSNDRWSASVEAVAGIENAGADACELPVLLCVRATETRSVAERLAACAPAAAVVSVQNGVDNDALLAGHFETVIGAVWRQTCTRIAANVVRFSGPGRVVVGLHPRGSAPAVERLAGDLHRAGFNVGISSRIAEDRWLKLCVNLMSAPNALIRRQDHTTRPFVEVKTRLLEEARAVLAAAGIEARSCDGVDRSLDDEIRYQREALERGTSARPIPLYNQVWTSLSGDAPLEADGYHEKILELARLHAIEAPINARVQAKLVEAKADARGPECFSARELLGP